MRIAIHELLIRGVTLRYFDPDTGRLELVVRAAGGETAGGTCRLEDVEMERSAGPGGPTIRASGRRGTYDRKTGSGSLEGNVVVSRANRCGSSTNTCAAWTCESEIELKGFERGAYFPTTCLCMVPDRLWPA